MPCRHRSRRKLTDQHTHSTHPVQQITVATRAGAAHTTREHRDRIPTRSQHPTVHSPFDPVGATSHQHTLPVREVASQLGGDMLPIHRSRPRTRDRHQIGYRPRQERGRAPHEQHIRGTLAQIIQRPRPMRITRNQSGDPAVLNHTQPLAQPAR